MRNDKIAAEFGRKIARVMLELRSSTVWFIIGKAYGDLSWDEAESLMKDVVSGGDEPESDSLPFTDWPPKQGE